MNLLCIKMNIRFIVRSRIIYSGLVRCLIYVPLRRVVDIYVRFGFKGNNGSWQLVKRNFCSTIGIRSIIFGYEISFF